MTNFLSSRIEQCTSSRKQRRSIVGLEPNFESPSTGTCNARVLPSATQLGISALTNARDARGAPGGGQDDPDRYEGSNFYARRAKTVGHVAASTRTCCTGKHSRPIPSRSRFVAFRSLQSHHCRGNPQRRSRPLRDARAATARGRGLIAGIAAKQTVGFVHAHDRARTSSRPCSGAQLNASKRSKASTAHFSALWAVSAESESGSTVENTLRDSSDPLAGTPPH